MTALGTKECLRPKLCPISCTATWKKNVSLKLSQQSKFNLKEIYSHGRAEGPILRVIKVNISCKPFINQKNKSSSERRGEKITSGIFQLGQACMSKSASRPVQWLTGKLLFSIVMGARYKPATKWTWWRWGTRETILYQWIPSNKTFPTIDNVFCSCPVQILKATQRFFCVYPKRPCPLFL